MALVISSLPHLLELSRWVPLKEEPLKAYQSLARFGLN